MIRVIIYMFTVFDEKEIWNKYEREEKALVDDSGRD